MVGEGGFCPVMAVYVGCVATREGMCRHVYGFMGLIVTICVCHFVTGAKYLHGNMPDSTCVYCVW